MTGTTPRLSFSLHHDIEVLDVMTANLTPYLYENELYGYLSGNLPQLTLGGLLLRLHRLSKIETHLVSDQKATVQAARARLETESAKWAIHYEKKLQHELASRLTALDQYVRECQENRVDGAAHYAVQAEKRTMIECLRDAAQKNAVLSDDLAVHIEHTDQRLRRLVRDGHFIYDSDTLADAYPAATYWWLYSHVAENQP